MLTDVPNTAACAILTACEDELERLRAHFTLKPEGRAKGKPLFLSFTFKDAKANEQRAIVRFFKSMGPSDARRATDQLLDRYKPSLVISVGVSGALAEYLCLGDVVIVTEADEYAHRGKAVKGSDVPVDISFGGRTFKPSIAVADVLSDVERSHPPLFESWQAQCTRDFPTNVDRESLLRDSLLHEAPRVYAGPVACGDTVGAAAAYKVMLKRRNRNFLALDMESSGVLQACEERGVPAIAIRTISDLADENKQTLESDSKYSIRNWASDNAYRLLDAGLRNLFDFPGPSRKKSRGAYQFNELANRFHEMAVKKYLKDPIRNLTPKAFADLVPYHELFRYVARTSLEQESQRTNVFEELGKYIIASQGQCPLRIEGRPGSGKTTFLSILYFALRLCRESAPACVPVYIDLKHYQELGTKERQVEALKNDLSILKTVDASVPGLTIIFLIDGVEEYSSAVDQLEAELFDLIRELPNRRQVIAVGLNFHYANAFRRSAITGYERAEETVILGALDVNDSRLDRFVDSFLALVPPSARKPTRQELLGNVSKFRIQSLDLYTLWLLSQNRNKPGFKGAQTLSAFYREYCSQYLKRDVGELASLAYRYCLQQDRAAQQQLLADPRGWKLLHTHSSMRDFLIAEHAVALVQRLSADPAALDELTYVFPQQISRFSKEIMNSAETTQAAVLSAAARALKDEHYKSLPWLCYLVGRIANARLHTRAVELLEQCRRWCRLRLEESEQPVAESPDWLLLVARTAFISRVALGDEAISNEYIDLMFQNRRWDCLNRAFHLEYYGDIDYIPRLEVDHQDPLEDFPNTYRTLYDRLSRQVERGPRYCARDIEMYTLLSLAQHRHAQGKLPPQLRQSIRDLIDRALTRIEAKPESETLQRYMEMMRRNLASESFEIGRIAEEFYRIKEIRRQGWLDRGLKAAESVADHTYGAYLLALVYLPETAPQIEGYDKREIADMLLIHDLGEAYLGDLVNKTDEDRQKERQSYEYIGALGTYAGVGDLERVKRLWDNFEQKMTINARIANDIDKLENLMQLYVYKKRGRTLHRFSDWERELVGEVETAFGKDILQIIRGINSRLRGTSVAV